MTPGRHRAVTAASAVLFVLVGVEAELGHEIADGGAGALVAVHVPNALLIMGLAAYLATTAARARRSS
ncbi:MAG: hypothetical protein J2P35_08520 [Actinobacteria bacterium]|nr:hypothetical protein [Actinomycetota bacterium]MBO0815434.1 hypothetical protein [Actinomycetota bacterium]